MTTILYTLLSVAYAATGVIGVLAYWPTIRDLYHHKKKSANISSYVLWTWTTCIAFLYALFIIPDTLLILASGFQFLACLVVLMLSVNLSRDK
ncbi:MAG: hypothetical protein ABL890_01610 [Candidatus Peribacteraceae bacterium]